MRPKARPGAPKGSNSTFEARREVRPKKEVGHSGLLRRGRDE